MQVPLDVPWDSPAWDAYFAAVNRRETVDKAIEEAKEVSVQLAIALDADEGDDITDPLTQADDACDRLLEVLGGA